MGKTDSQNDEVVFVKVTFRRSQLEALRQRFEAEHPDLSNSSLVLVACGFEAVRPGAPENNKNNKWGRHGRPDKKETRKGE